MGRDEQAKGQGAWGEEESTVWTRCEKWLARHEGFVRGAVAVRRLALGGERGVFASTPISKGDLLSSTPLSAILCPACPTLRRRPASSSVSSSNEDAEDESLLESQSVPIDPRYAALVDLLDKMSGSILAFALLVLFELTQNPAQSPWQPYLAMMPDQVDTLEWWEERELRELDGEGACWSVGSTAAIRARRTASATFATTIQPILRVHSGVFTQAVSDEQWRRAFTIMTTRSFYISGLGSYGMVPWADMYNHSHTVSKDMKIYDKERQTLSVYAYKAYAADEQIFVTYGERLTNVQLLLNFGFLLPDNFTVLPLARLPSLISAPQPSTSASTETAPTPPAIAKADHPEPALGLPSLCELAAGRANFFLEFDERGEPKASESLNSLYGRLVAAASASDHAPWRISLPTASEAHFIAGLVRQLLAARQGDDQRALSSSMELPSYRQTMLAGLRRWEAQFLLKYQHALSSPPPASSSGGAS